MQTTINILFAVFVVMVGGTIEYLWRSVSKNIQKLRAMGYDAKLGRVTGFKETVSAYPPEATVLSYLSDIADVLTDIQTELEQQGKDLQFMRDHGMYR